MPKKKIPRIEHLFETLRQEESSLPAPEQPRIRARRPSAAGSLTPSKHVASEAVYRLEVPLRLGERVFGNIQVLDDVPLSPDGDEYRFVQQVTEQLTLALENARLFEETQKRALQQGALYALSTRLAQTHNIKEICQITVQMLREQLGFAFSGIFLLDPLNGDRVLQAQSGWDEAPPDWRIPAGKGLSRFAVETGQLYYWPDVTKEPEYIPGLRESHTEADVPIKIGDEVMGVLIAEDQRVNAFTQDDLDLLLAVANVLAIAIQNARLLEETQRRAEEMALLNRVVSIAGSTLNLSESLQAIVREIVENFPVDHGGLTLLDENKEVATVIAEHGKRPFTSVIGVRFRVSENPAIQEVLQSRRPLFIEDAQNDARMDPALREEFKKRGFTKLAIFPILAGNEVIGTLGLDITDPQTRLSPSDLALIQTILTQVSSAIQQAWLFKQTQDSREALKRQNEYLAAAAEIGRLVTSALDLKTIFSRAVNLVQERFGYYHAGIFVVEETGFNAILEEATGEAGAEMKRRGHFLPVGSKSIVGTVTASGEPLVVNDVSQNPIHRFNPLLPETRAEAAIPLRIGQRVIGALDVQSTQVNAFSEDDIRVLQMLADQIAVAIDNARSYQIVQDAMREMREADRMKSQFLANMSHELRTPLNSIIGFSRVILKGIDGPITELQRQDLTAIYNSGQHLLGLINDILDLSKIEAGKMELTFDEVNLAEIITSVMSTAAGLVKDKPITLKRSIPENLPTVRADATRIRQVLLNLLSNAAKFTEQGEIRVEASVQTNADGQEEVLVKVSDTGPGIPEEDQKKLFQPFSQVDASLTRKTGGTGLGLAISAQLIQLHGGTIGVQSKMGEGSTFYFTVPVYQKKVTPSADKPIILAIDDDPQVIALYERYLAPLGYQIIGLTEPRQSVEQALRLQPFAITLDIMMPGYDGWQVLTDLKSNPGTREIPVIICSIVEDREKGFSMGAADYLVKPILQEDLVRALDRLNADGSIHEVLIIDDNAEDLRLLEKTLREGGHYRPILAEGGEKGWNMLLQHRPHAIILDLFMPDLDGFTLLERMRTSPELRDIPVIVISGGELTPAQQKQLQEFGQRLIQKGAISETELFSTLERALRRVHNPQHRTSRNP
ncbi:MAG: GAF domain-containing protein [Anaerolineales bacterium]